MILFWGIVFPFHARNFEIRGYFRYIHIAMVLAAVVVPLESVGVILGTGGLTIPRFPAVACFARKTDASYFAFVLPLSIASAIGVPLIVVILWSLITKVGNLKPSSKVSGRMFCIYTHLRETTFWLSPVKQCLFFIFTNHVILSPS